MTRLDGETFCLGCDEITDVDIKSLDKDGSTSSFLCSRKEKTWRSTR